MADHNAHWSFTDRVVAITGSAVGIGSGAVAAFAVAGATVYGLDVDQDRGESGAAESGATFVECDVTPASSV